MIKEDEVKAKVDAELLDIWANQHEYVSEMIPWVRTEIARRGLEITGIHIRTNKEVEDELAQESTVGFVRAVAAIQACSGLIIGFFAVLMIKDALVKAAAYGGETPDLRQPLIMLPISAALITFAIGVWKRHRWAIYCGLSFYGLSTVINAIAAVMGGLALLAGNRAGGSTVRLALIALGLLLSSSLATAFNALRKSSPAKG